MRMHSCDNDATIEIGEAIEIAHELGQHEAQVVVHAFHRALDTMDQAEMLEAFHSLCAGLVGDEGRADGRDKLSVDLDQQRAVDWR